MSPSLSASARQYTESDGHNRTWIHTICHRNRWAIGYSNGMCVGQYVDNGFDRDRASRNMDTDHANNERSAARSRGL